MDTEEYLRLYEEREANPVVPLEIKTPLEEFAKQHPEYEMIEWSCHFGLLGYTSNKCVTIQDALHDRLCELPEATHLWWSYYVKNK